MRTKHLSPEGPTVTVPLALVLMVTANFYPHMPSQHHQVEAYECMLQRKMFRPHLDLQYPPICLGRRDRHRHREFLEDDSVKCSEKMKLSSATESVAAPRSGNEVCIPIPKYPLSQSLTYARRTHVSVEAAALNPEANTTGYQIRTQPALNKCSTDWDMVALISTRVQQSMTELRSAETDYCFETKAFHDLVMNK